jgi:hypothetical protein
MWVPDRVAAIQVGQGAGHLEDTVDHVLRQPQVGTKGVVETTRVAVRLAMAEEILLLHGGIDCDFGGGARETVLLDKASVADSGGHLRARLGGASVEIEGCDRWRRDEEIDGVEKDARDPRTMAFEESG